MSDDIRYEVLKGQYNAAVAQRDQLQTENEALKRQLAREDFAAREMMAIVCDNTCGRAIVGETLEAIDTEAKRRKWFRTPPSAKLKRDYCNVCHIELQTPL